MYVACVTFPKDVLFNVYVDKGHDSKCTLMKVDNGQFLFQVQLIKSKLVEN